MATVSRSTKSRKPRTTSNVAHITPAVLSWAIERGGYSYEKLAKRLRVDVQQLKNWEQGMPPPFSKAEDLANLLRIPFGYLYLAAPPDADLPLPDMRRLETSYRPTQNFLDLLSDVLVRQDWYRDYLLELAEPQLDFVGKFNASSAVEDVADDIRRTLGVGSRFRRGVRDWDAYGAALSERAEASRILVMRSSLVGNDTTRPISVNEVQGFALADDIAPVVFVNAADFAAPRVFTLAHELAHIWIGQSAVSNPDQGEATLNRIEMFCNRVATEVLVPQSEFVSAWRTASRASARVESLTRVFWVSALVIIRRARELHIVSRAEADALRKEAIAAQRPRTRKGGDYYRNATVRAGHRFTDAVVTEVGGGNLTFAHAGRLLGMTAHSVVKLASVS